jgi:hypothetical protein
MKTLNKILAIGALALTSLIGCTREYHIDNKIVYYNDGDSNPMVILSDSSKTVYQTEHKKMFSRTTGKDISEVKIAKTRNPIFRERLPKYSYFPKKYSQYIKKDSAVMNRERNNFDYYISKIDSIEKSKKVK